MSILLLLGKRFGGITSDYLATITVWTNKQATPSSSVCLEPANKKLRLLENLKSDDNDGDGSMNSSKDDDTSTFRITREVPAIFHWRRHANTYQNLSRIAKVYSALSASSVPVKSMLFVAGLVKSLQHSAISPHRLSHVCSVHDNYANFSD